MADSSTSSSAAMPQHHQQSRPSPAPAATTTPMASFLAGIAGGSASTTLLYPLDLIKVRMQVDERRRQSVLNNNGGGSASGHPTMAARPEAKVTSNPADKPRTICCTVRGVIRHEGYLGLYRGLTPAIIGSAASWGGFFILYEELKRQMLHRKQVNLSRTTSSILAATMTEEGENYDLTKDMHVDEEMDINTNATTNNIISSDTSNNIQNINSKSKIDKDQQQNQQQARLGPIEHFSASCLAGACMVALTNPLWLIKTRLQLQNSRLQEQILSQSPTATKVAIQSSESAANPKVKPPYRGLVHAAYTIVQEEGILALYKGSVPALMLVSHGGIQFVTYEFMKGHFANFTNNNNNKSGQWKKSSGRSKGTIGERLRDSLGYLVMGAVSKFVASTTTYPLQVIKARLQQRSQAIEVSETTGEIIVTKREYSGVMDCITKILRNEGVNGFFKGCVTNAVRVAPSAAITFVTYEFVLDMLTE